MTQILSTTFVLTLFLFNGLPTAETQGLCGKYTCERNTDFTSSLILKCTSDRPGSTGNASSNFDCNADLHLLDLTFGVTICSRVAPSYSMNVLPDAPVSRELQRLYRFLQAIVSQTANTNSRCYRRNIQPPRPPSSTTVMPPGGSTQGSTTRPKVDNSVLIGAVIGAFIGGALLATIIFVSIYFCCVSRKKEKARRFVINPRINEAYQRDPNDNLDTTPTDLRQKDWSREHRGRMDRLNGMIDAFTLENVVDPYATIEENEQPQRRAPPRPIPLKPTPEEISAMYSKVDRTKKTRAPNGNVVTESSQPGADNSSEIYIKGRTSNTAAKTGDESVAGSSEIVPPENSLHLYHIIERPDES